MSLIQGGSDVMTVDEAADLLRISRADMDILIARGEVKHVKICDNILILREFLDIFLAESCQMCYNDSAPGDGHGIVEPGAPHLDNCITSGDMPFSGGTTEMAIKINQYITVNGVKRWIRAGSAQEFADKIAALLAAPAQSNKTPFDTYAWTWFNIYSKPNIETATAATYERQLTRHLLPAFSGLAVEDITTDEVQKLFNGMTGAKVTKDKAKMVLNQILEAAIEDKIITHNPLKSRRLKVTGKASRATVPYTVEQMRYLVQHMGDIKDPTDRAYLALQALHPLRLEEVLGLHFEDIDTADMSITICRAVTHPTRNQPEIKDTKTSSSARTIGLSGLALPYIISGTPGKYVFGEDAPLSYTQVRHMCERIKKDTGFSENITPIRFRTTVLTDLYDQTKDIKLAQAAAGHTTSAMTLKYYVKGRETSSLAAAAVDRAYSA